MRNLNLNQKIMALWAMIFFSFTTYSWSQNTIKTPDTSKELKNDSTTLTNSNEKESPAPFSSPSSSPSYASPRQLRTHGIGLGLGQTFLLGKYNKSGEDKITLDLFYSYAASYSFDLLVNVHRSEHKFKNERMRLFGTSAAVKARLVEFDNFSPYILGGLGFYAPRAKREIAGNRKWSEQKVTFGTTLGTGADLRLNERYVVGLLGQFHWPFMIKQEDQPNIRGSYFKLLITGSYLF